MPDVKSVQWITASGKTIGMIRAEDKITKEMFIYVGVGEGLDEATDVDLILSWGAKIPEQRFMERIAELMIKNGGRAY